MSRKLPRILSPKEPKEYLEAERIEGNLLYLKGHRYPLKGIPSVEKVKQASVLKKALTRPWKTVDIPEDTLGIFATELYRIVEILTKNTRLAHKIAFIVEYDQAYRYRLQDLFTSSTKEVLVSHPFEEILRLQALHRERDRIDFTYTDGQRTRSVNYTHNKIWYLFPLAALYIATHRRRWKKAMQQATYNNLVLDEGDKYWASMKKDYKYSM